ncbi:tetratricopeptide repeat protein 5-like [Coccinella septempunctata]|uniref:tetratricopeptide repeat protein 5-like n=1 Tax=Coccinella septempunctata TaxID=41139 RepID=UPI001D06C835|nr:tetratricopeptide repeat protein 5-like [Coccinella septempunctata]
MNTLPNDNKLVSDENYSSKSDVLVFLEEKLENVCNFRDRYFETHSLDDAIHKNDDLKKLQEETLKIFEENETAATKSNKAKYFFMKGALLNVVPEYSKDAENLLSKAIKLDRKLVEAWNELGDCYWKNDEVKKSKSCFEGALKERKNKVSLRNLSMLSRQEVVISQAECIANVEKGLNYAKEAVKLDAQDGLSWSCLGNAHLSYFFHVQQNPKILKQAISAYFQAEKDIVARSSPDLHYNKGIMLKYKEEFKEALESFKKSSLYDPTWDRPKKREQQLIEYLNNIEELVSTKGKMKTKKLKNLLDSIDSKHLGPYLEDTKNILTGANARLIRVNIQELKPGVNELKVLLGKVVCSVRNEDTVPFTFCLVDETGECVVVTLFNLADGKGVIIGDSVAIPEPLVTDVNFDYNSVSYKFRLIRVETPILVAVNGKLLQKDQTAGVQMSIFRKFD